MGPENLVGITRQATVAQASERSPKPEEVQKATREFEAMWIELMLHSARPEAGATLTGESDSTRDMVLDMADQQIARLLTAQGGFGLSRMVQQGFKSTPQPVNGSVASTGGSSARE